MRIVQPEHGRPGRLRPSVAAGARAVVAVALAVIVLLAVIGSEAEAPALHHGADGVLTAPQRWSLDAANRTS
jgi:hypothetical protein